MNGVAASAEEWGISPRVAWTLAWIPIIAAAAVLSSYASRPLYRFLTMEDGPIEWAQFLFYAGTCILCASIAYRRLKAGHPWQALLFAGLAFATLFISGEEIAWGQRIFGIQTPEGLKEINAQGETTVHNIGKIQDAFNLAMFFAAGYAAVAYFLRQRIDIGSRWDQANYLFIPPLFLVPSFLVTFVYKLIRYTVVRQPGFTVTRYAELAELCLAFGLCVFVYLNDRRLASPAVAPMARASHDAILSEKTI
jgi:hypothetical protein